MILISYVAFAVIINDNQSILSYICVTTETIIAKGLVQFHFVMFFPYSKKTDADDEGGENKNVRYRVELVTEGYLFRGVCRREKNYNEYRTADNGWIRVTKFDPITKVTSNRRNDDNKFVSALHLVQFLPFEFLLENFNLFGC